MYSFAEQIIRSEAAGSAPHDVMLIVPTIVGVGEQFDIGVSVLDRTGRPSTTGTNRLTVLAGEALERARHVEFAPGRVAACRICGARITKPGVFRVRAMYDGRSHHSNPVHCLPRPRRRVWWGDPHIHTTLSDCHVDSCRTPDVGCVAARDVYFLDFVSLTDHVSNGRGSKGKWKTLRAIDARYDEPGRFTMLPGYEASLKSGSGGDNNVYFHDSLPHFVDAHDDGDVLTLCKGLKGKRFFVVPHHTSRARKHGALREEIYPGPETMPLVEIHSKWGTSEYRGNPYPLREVAEGPCFAQDLLAQGYHLGFIAGTDTHTTLTFARGIEPRHIDRPPGITAVIGSHLSRASIFRNLRSRNCYATTGERILLEVSVCGRPMGTEVTCSRSAAPTRRTLRVRCAAREDILSVEIVRSGEVIHVASPSQWLVEFEHVDATPWRDCALSAPRLGSTFAYYYVRVTTRGGAMAWSSPIRFSLTARRERRRPAGLE
jgi:hypothetical protein